MIVEEVVVLDDAVNDLEQGRDFYDFVEPGVGDYFIDALLADIGSLKLHAGVHSQYHGFFKSLSRRFPFAVYYDIEGTIVRVAAVLDMRQSPNTIGDILSSRKSG